MLSISTKPTNVLLGLVQTTGTFYLDVIAYIPRRDNSNLVRSCLFLLYRLVTIHCKLQMGRIDGKMDQTIVMLNSLAKRWEERDDLSLNGRSRSASASTFKKEDV